ncbi:MAG: penicillin-binding protein 1C [Labilithrix sp.]|nr:penicillin-binding protein 1C [Labilithrix sp.]
MSASRLRAILRRRAVRAPLVVIVALFVSWRIFRAMAGSPAAEIDGARWTEGTRVLARDGRVLGERASSLGLRGRRVALDDVSPRLVLATVASEDRAFYRHDGVDRLALARASLSNVKRGKIVSGGSTITAQLVKRLDHQGRPHRRTIATKLVEMARAQNLEAAMDKRAILEAYLNHLDYGHGLAGPEAAARGYFGVSARDVSLAQAALLAVLPRAPSALDPYRHLDRAVARQRALLHAMHARGDVSSDDLSRALAEIVAVRPLKRSPLVAPHLVLAAARGSSPIVETTIDFDLQRDAEAIVTTHVPLLRARGASGAAAIVVDNATGDVLAEIGSADYFDRDAGAVDLVRARRQAGSTLKPFLYARAFERGMSPMQTLADVPTELGTTGAVYAPDNFDGVFAGPVSAREALAGSLNVPAVRIAVDLGPREIVSTLRRAGLELRGGVETYGTSIALGSAEVSPIELAEAYATLARGGDRVGVTDRKRPSDGGWTAGERVFEASAAALVADALADPIARIRGLRTRATGELSFPVAMKTGTSTAYRDAWMAGFTRERTVVVWVGNPSGAPTSKLTGAAGAGPIFFDVMKRAMRDVGSRAALADVALTEETEVCALSGHLPGDACPDRVSRKFARGRLPGNVCNLHRHARDGRCVGEERAPVAVVLPAAFDRFLAERAPGAPGLDPHGLPWLAASRMTACAAEGAEAKTTSGEPRVVLVKPRPGAIFHADDVRSDSDVLEVVATTEGLPDGSTLEILVDGDARASLRPPYKGIVAIARGEHTIEVRPKEAAVMGRVARADIIVR